MSINSSKEKDLEEGNETGKRDDQLPVGELRIKIICRIWKCEA